MEKFKLLYEGKAKKVYLTEADQVVRLQYLDQVTAGNGARKDKSIGKGALNNQITSKLFSYLARKGINSHFLSIHGENDQLVKQVSIIPLEVVVRNRAAGSFSERLAVKEGTVFNRPIVEFYYKKDELNDPLLTDAQVEILGLSTSQEMEAIKEIALRVNKVLTELFQQIDILLVDFKLEFGKDRFGELLLADEISPDTCRLWEISTGNHLDKDVYRRELGSLLPVYTEVLERLETVID